MATNPAVKPFSRRAWRRLRAWLAAAAGIAAVAGAGAWAWNVVLRAKYPAIPSEAVVLRYLDWVREPVWRTGRTDPETGEIVWTETPKAFPGDIPDKCLPRSAEADPPDPRPVFWRGLPRMAVSPWFLPAAERMYEALVPDSRLPNAPEWFFPSETAVEELVVSDFGESLIRAALGDAPTIFHEEEERYYWESLPPSYGPPPDPAIERTLLAYDPLVFHVPADSPVTNLTTDQLRKIFVDRVPTWRDAGVDAPGRVFAYEREYGERAQLLAAAWLKGTGILERLSFDAPRKRYPVRSVRRWWSVLRTGYYTIDDPPGGTMEPFRPRPGAIGFSMHVQAAPFVENGTIRLLAVDGIFPTADNIARGFYPVGRSLELVSTSHGDPDLKTIRDYLRSDAGRRLVESAGYLPAPDDAPLPPLRDEDDRGGAVY